MDLTPVLSHPMGEGEVALRWLCWIQRISLLLSVRKWISGYTRRSDITHQLAGEFQAFDGTWHGFVAMPKA
jgi:hypothetical protein